MHATLFHIARSMIDKKSHPSKKPLINSSHIKAILQERGDIKFIYFVAFLEYMNFKRATGKYTEKKALN